MGSKKKSKYPELQNTLHKYKDIRTLQGFTSNTKVLPYYKRFKNYFVFVSPLWNDMKLKQLYCQYYVAASASQHNMHA